MAIHTNRVEAEQPARRQVLLREVNEQIAKLTGLRDTDYRLLICECSNVECAESLEIRPAEYEAVRAGRARFVVVPGHQVAGTQRVVSNNGRYLVVETLARERNKCPYGA